MPKRIVSWAILLFSFSIIALGFKPDTDEWGVAFDTQFHVPYITSPYVLYLVIGTLAIGISIFLIVVSFKEKWSNRVEHFVDTTGYYLGFVIYFIVYAMSYIKGVSAVISIEPPVWVVNLVFYFGFLLFLFIPFSYFKGLFSFKKTRKAKEAKSKGLNYKFADSTIQRNEWLAFRKRTRLWTIVTVIISIVALGLSIYAAVK